MYNDVYIYIYIYIYSSIRIYKKKIAIEKLIHLVA